MGLFYIVGKYFLNRIKYKYKQISKTVNKISLKEKVNKIRNKVLHVFGLLIFHLPNLNFEVKILKVQLPFY